MGNGKKGKLSLLPERRIAGCWLDVNVRGYGRRMEVGWRKILERIRERERERSVGCVRGASPKQVPDHLPTLILELCN